MPQYRPSLDRCEVLAQNAQDGLNSTLMSPTAKSPHVAVTRLSAK